MIDGVAIARLLALPAAAAGLWWLWRRQQRWRRERLRALPLSDGQRALLERQMPLYRALPQTLKAELNARLQVLLSEKRFEGCNGMVVSDEMRCLVLAHAALMTLRHGDFYYPGLRTILLYPEPFYVDVADDVGDGLAVRRRELRAGESWQRGAVILSWDDVEDSLAARDGFNVMIHEFAHQLDQAGEGEGVPRLRSGVDYAPWRDAFSEAYLRLERQVDARRQTFLDPYAAEEPAEFFAVACEAFFEIPKALRQAEPAVYACLCRYFGWDPANIAI